MRRILFLIVVLLTATSEAWNATRYEQLLKMLENYKPEPNKPVLLVFYTPMNCASCNYPLSLLLNHPEMSKKWGRNTFVIFNKIRAIEVADYKTNLKEHGNMDITVVNDGEIYHNLYETYVPNDNGAKPFAVLHMPNDKQTTVSLTASDLNKKMDSILRVNGY